MGIWSISCVGHVWNSENSRFNSNNFNVPKQSGNTYSKSINEWYQFIKENGAKERKIVYIDNDSWPNNIGCSFN